ncbi:MAG TPA: hypothetical protein VF526_19165 [Solirubrobacteraceae bacterium]
MAATVGIGIAGVNVLATRKGPLVQEANPSVGLSLELIFVDDVEVLADQSRACVRVYSAEVDPASAFFHKKLYTWPAFTADIWRSLALFETSSRPRI